MTTMTEAIGAATQDGTGAELWARIVASSLDGLGDATSDHGGQISRPRIKFANPTDPATTFPDSLLTKTRESGMVVSIADCTEPPPRRWLVQKLIPEGAASSLYGDGGVGKSNLALMLASSVALGTEFAGLPTRRCCVLWLDAEMDLQEFLRRAYAVARGMGRERPPEGVLYHCLMKSLAREEGRRAVDDPQRALRPGDGEPDSKGRLPQRRKGAAEEA